MTAIDWTKPVETTEDPPRPVRVLCTDAGEQYPIVALISREPILFTKDGHEWPDGIGITLRNVPPPKPAPVLREAWVVWDADGAVLFFTNETSARLHGGVCARAAVMSDGSPVEEDPTRYGVCEVCVEKAVKSADEWRSKAEALQAEVDRMRPIVETAVIYCTTGQDRGGEKLLTAVKQYVAREQRND